MILGLSSSLTYRSPKEWARKHRELGCGAVVFPADCNAPEAEIEAFREAAEQEGLVIAEVGIWKNALAADPEERARAVDYSVRQLQMADRIGARCCVNVAGTPNGPVWDGAYPGNFSPETWDMTVASIQNIIDQAAPRHTKFSVEPMPWMVPTGPDEYQRLLRDVDRDAFGVHLDLVNMINCPQRYFFADEFMEECFAKLHGRIVSCHLKDIQLLQPLTFQLKETACGAGSLHLEKYAQLASREDEGMPMIIEHLHAEEEYLQSLRYVQKRLAPYIRA